MKSCLNFGWSIISSLNRRKLEELSILLNDLVDDQTENFPYLQWYLALLDHVERRRFVNKGGTSKWYKTIDKRIIFSQTKKSKSSIFLKLCDLKTFLLKCLLICLNVIFLWLLMNCKNLSGPNYSTIKFLESSH